jgi:hypothetical protein
MMMRYLLIVAVFLAASASGVLADKGPGCGLGRQIFIGQNGKGPHLLAATTNSSLSPSSFSITSGTSGCEADAVILREHEQEMFVAQNIDSLSQDMAMGSGQYLHAMADLMGCGAGSFSDFASLTQAKYELLLPSAGTAPAAFLTGLKQELAAQPSLAASCSRIS